MNTRLAFIAALLFALGLTPVAEAAGSVPATAQATAPTAGATGQKAHGVKKSGRASAHKTRARRKVARNKAPATSKTPPR